jgi:L-ascorbate metabolism protein UlaG (beta-lactamase superfamily)
VITAMPATITWLGNSSLRIDSVHGKRVYVDPWLSGPTTPDDERAPERVDLIALTHGHLDHLGDAVELSTTHRAHVIAQTELSTWLFQNGAYLIDPYGMNKGGTMTYEGIGFTMVHASHSGSAPDGTYTGEAVGFVVTFEDGKRVYLAGDTDVFLDMQLIGELYAPDVAVLPIGDRMTMGPRQAAKAIELLGVKRILPVHWDGGDIIPGRPEHLIELLGSDTDVDVIQVRHGESFAI